MSTHPNKNWHKGACHCRAVTFEVNSAQDVQITHCNCSMCKMTGYQHLIVEQNDFRLLSGRDNLTSYTFNTHTAKHIFCKTCGVKSFYVPRSHPDGISVNFRCVDKDGFGALEICQFDGDNWEDNIADLLED